MIPKGARVRRKSDPTETGTVTSGRKPGRRGRIWRDVEFDRDGRTYAIMEDDLEVISDEGLRDLP